MVSRAEQSGACRRALTNGSALRSLDALPVGEGHNIHAALVKQPGQPRGAAPGRGIPTRPAATENVVVV